MFCDPARRTDHGRTFDPAAFSPSFRLRRSRCSSQARFAAAKLAPGLDHALIPAGIEAEWVSFGGGVKEAVLWSAGFLGAGVRRRASVLPAGLPADRRRSGRAARSATIGGYLYEPDGAVIRAGLVRQVAALLPGGRRIDEHLAYLSADAPLAADPAWPGASGCSTCCRTR